MPIPDAVAFLLSRGWVWSERGLVHRQFLYLDEPRVVTIAGERPHDLGRETWKSILKQAGEP